MVVAEREEPLLLNREYPWETFDSRCYLLDSPLQPNLGAPIVALQLGEMVFDASQETRVNGGGRH